MQAKTKAAHSSTTYHAPIVHVIDRRTTPIIDEFDHATKLGGLLIAISFGVMMLVGAWFGWI